MGKLEWNADCPPDLILSFECFNSRLTESHTSSAKANKYSIWHLVHEDIEPTVAKILGSSLYGILAPQGLSRCAKSDSKGLKDRCRHHARIFSNLSAFSQRCMDVHSTLDSLITLISFCNSRLPHTDTKHSGRRRRRTDLEHFPFCELCYKLCEAEKIRVTDIVPDDVARKSPSMRFCNDHKSGTSAYRRDLNYRDAFHNKIIELEKSLKHMTCTEDLEELKEVAGDSVFQGHDIMTSLIAHYEHVDDKSDKQVEYARPNNYHLTYFNIDKSIRYVAYRAVRNISNDAVQMPSKPRDSNTLFRLIASIKKGNSIPDAARDVGISRQAAWKALKKAGII